MSLDLCQFLLRPFCYVVFAKSFIYAQDYMWHWQNYIWHWQIHLLTFTIELSLDMNLAWDPTFIKYPINKIFMEPIFTNSVCNSLACEIA